MLDERAAAVGRVRVARIRVLRIEEAVRDAEARETCRLGGARDRHTVIDVAQPVIDHEAHVRSRSADAWMMLRAAGDADAQGSTITIIL